MEQATHKIEQEYWRPVLAHGKREMPFDGRARAEVCESCSSEFVVGARFCHVCGGDRQAAAATSNPIAEILDFDRIRHALGLSVASLVAFIFGMASVIAAFTVGFIYSANTLADWQAVQTWRIEWMLAAVVAFVAGILLKKAD
ncbi:MAG TPA: hypothetical protein VH088_17595 [Terriglobales bacterium]|jgi:hypothetical protein|nr:hypothetical protein [Terriglobales bacterium]